MMQRPRLVTLLLGPILAALVVGAVAVGVLVHAAVERDMRSTLDDELSRALTAQARRPAEARGPERVDRIVVIDPVSPFQFTLQPDGAITNESDPELAALAVRELQGDVGPVTVAGDPDYRFGARERADGTTVVIGIPVTTLDSSLASLRRNLILGGLVLVVLLSLVVLVVASRIQRPIGRLRTVAHQIAAGDLDAEPDPGTGPRETVELSVDLALMLDQLRRTIDERAAAAAAAEQSRIAMERFVADASHELLTPLTALQGYSNLHAAGMLDAEGLDRAMLRIGSESERLAVLTRDLLDLVRREPDQAPEHVDVAAVATGVVHDLRAANAGKRIELENASTTAVAVGYPARLHQAILNLASNACQHTPAEASVVVRVERLDDWVEVHVIDDGPGIDPEHADELFAPFARGDASRSRRSHDGAGLGLAIVKAVAEQHGGTVSVRATRGGGSTFVLRLPAAAEH